MGSDEPVGRRSHGNHGDTGHHFDLLKRVSDGCVRILLNNVNGIGFVGNNKSRESIKMEKLKKVLIDNNFSYAGLTETNKDWRNFSYADSIWGATESWFEHRTVQVSQNTNLDARSECLYGGTASMAMGELTFRICAKGQDARNLGRWSTTTVRGKNELKTTIITCYCPVFGRGPLSSYSQHLKYMADNPDLIPDDITCPRNLFGFDLKSLVTSLQQEDHQIILMGDFNCEYSILEEWMLDIGLVNSLKERYGHEGPRTCIKSKDSPIDCIFVSPQISIKQGGLLSFGRLDSDHRGLWIDIPAFLLYGYNPPPLLHPQARRLKLQDPRVVEKYLTYLHSAFREHNLFAKMDALHAQAVYPLHPDLAAEFETIYKLSNELMDEAEEQCRKLKTGAVAWSPAFARATDLVEYWERRERYKKKKCKNVRYLINLQRKLNIKYDPSLSLSAISAKAKQARLHRRECKANAESLSKEYRTQLAMAKEEAGEMKAAVALRNMNRVEGIRRLYRHIRFMEGKLKGGSISQVIVHDDDGITKEYTAKEDVESKIIEENVKKYHQTESGGCQFLDDEYRELFGDYGEGPAVPDVLAGTFVIPESATQDTRAFIEACAYLDGVDREMETPDIVNRFRTTRTSWGIRKEKTSTYNHHLGHYKAIMKDDYLSWFYFQRSDIPTLTGYSPDRHRTCADLMILKKAMIFDIRKQRTIGILDTEFNQLNKALGYTITSQALKYDSFATEQFSRPGRSAIDQCISKRCAIDHHRSRRLCFAMTSCDLAGCYDRIVHTAAALAMLRIGISHAKVESMFSTIQRMVHCIRTSFGDSEGTYGGDDYPDWRAAPQGVLQGNASGPAIWSVLSSVVFDILQSRGFSVEFCGAISKSIFKIVGYSYVDDCDLFQSGEDPLEVLESMQALIKSWGSLVEVTGGTLRPDKSWWYLIEYVWHRGKWIAADARDDLDLFAIAPNGDEVTLKRLHADTSAEMLGIWMSPSGNNSKIVSVLKRQALEWAGKIRLGRPSKEEAFTALKTTISAKLKYPLACSTLSEKECKSIMYPALRAALGKSGFASNLPTRVRDGPISSGGAGIISLFHFQGSARIAALVEHVMRGTPTGKQILMCVEDLALDAGMYGLLWNMPFPKIKKWIERHSWIYAILEYNHDNNISINCPHATFEPQRKRDKSIMSCVSDFTSDVSELKSINRVRQYHGVIHLSDIASADGNFLNPEFLCSAEFDGRRNDYLWPVRHRVQRSDYTPWRKALECLFPVNPLRLIVPMGRWYIEEDTVWLDHWDWFTSETTEFLFRQVGENVWRRHVKIVGTARSFHQQFLTLDARPVERLHRATVREIRNAWVLTSTDSEFRHRPVDTPSDTFDAITIRHPTIQWFHQYLEASDNTASLYRHLRNGTAIAVSDGSYFPDEDVGACAWIIATPTGSEWITGGGLMPDGDDSYRAELGGQVGIASALEGLELLPGHTIPSIKCFCDGLSALKKTGVDPDKIRSRQSHVDLVSILSRLWKSLPINIKREHVYGHTDKLTRELTVPEWLNCWMDSKAKAIARYHMSTNRRGPFRPTSLGLGTITVHGSRIKSHVQKSIYHVITHRSFVERLSETLEVPQQLLDASISWSSFGKARKQSRISTAAFVTKWLSNTAATGVIMVARKQRLCSNCPLCDQADEDVLHVLTCQSTSASEKRETLLQEFKVWLQSVKTDPDIVSYLVTGLRSWFKDPFGDEPLHRTTSDRAFRAISTQLEIGWFALLCGYITTDLIQCQHFHYADISSKKHGSSWGKQLTIKLWDLTFALWKHRNASLHDTDAIDHLSGLDALKDAISTEHSLGQADLPMPYSPFFYLPLPSLLRKSTSYLKRWFMTVRSGREHFQPLQTFDDFSTNVQLRTWVGLNSRT